MITNTQKALLEALSHALFGGDIIPLTDEMSAEAKQQAVYSLIAKGKGVYPTVINNIRVAYAQEKVGAALKGIPYVVLKGLAAAVYYPEPFWRTLGDIDIMVRPEDFDAACTALLAAGYKTDDAIDNATGVVSSNKSDDMMGESLNNSSCNSSGNVADNAADCPKTNASVHTSNKITDKRPRHIHFHRNGVLIELHRTYAELNTPEAEALLDGWIYQGISHPAYARVLDDKVVVGQNTTPTSAEQFTVEQSSVERSATDQSTSGQAINTLSSAPSISFSSSADGQPFPMLPEPLNGLTLLAHISQHLEDGLGLRQIIDWVMYVDKQLHDDTWPQFKERTDLLGLTKLAKVTARLGQMYLGLDNNIMWCKGVDDALATELLEYVFECGNFGQKAPMSNTVTYVLSHGKGLSGFFRNLQRRGEGNWLAYQRHHILKPFCWIYQAGRYASRGLKNGHTLSALGRDWSSSRKRNRLIEALGATQLAVRDKGKK